MLGLSRLPRLLELSRLPKLPGCRGRQGRRGRWGCWNYRGCRSCWSLGGDCLRKMFHVKHLFLCHATMRQVFHVKHVPEGKGAPHEVDAAKGVAAAHGFFLGGALRARAMQHRHGIHTSARKGARGRTKPPRCPAGRRGAGHLRRPACGGAPSPRGVLRAVRVGCGHAAWEGNPAWGKRAGSVGLLEAGVG